MQLTHESGTKTHKLGTPENPEVFENVPGHVIPIIAKYSVANGGSVAFIQLDNEILDAHLYFGGLDYNAVTMGFGAETGRLLFSEGNANQRMPLVRRFQTPIVARGRIVVAADEQLLTFSAR